MSYIEKVSWMSESGYSDIELLEYINKHFDEIECEFVGEKYKEPRLGKVDFGLHQMWFM